MDQSLSHYGQLSSLGVDLTQYIINEASIPEKVTKIVAESAGSSRAKVSPNIHFHMGGNSHTVGTVRN